MTPERWERINRIFEQAIELPPGQREEFLRRECRNGEEYDTVSRMIEEHFRESGPLDDRPTWPSRRTRPVFAEGQMVAGRYRVIRFIGRGGMGEVYEVEDQELRERVALKTLLPEIAADERMIARFKQEIQLSRRIGHPNVCRMFDLGRHPGDGFSQAPVVFLSEELLEGETLSERLQREGRFSPEATLPVIEQMAAGLDAVHRAGILHRDLKPSNVMLAGRAVLTDFGLARTFTPSAELTATQTGQAMGTVDYMAPELLTGKAATVSSDIYALGMVAYKMVTGALPFDAETPFAAAILRSKAPIPPPSSKVPGLDPVFERAILRALDAEPKRRFASATDFMKALRGEAVTMTLSLPVMTRRRWVGAVAAVAVLVAGGVGWRSWSQSEALAFYQQGVNDIHAGAYFAATKALEEAVRVAPRFSLAHARLAEAWNELDVSERAGQEMLLARREDTSGLPARDRLQMEAIQFTITREFDEAVTRYDRLRPFAEPSNGRVDLDLGRAYEKAGQPVKAIEHLRKAAGGQFHNPAAWLQFAVLYSHLGDPAKSAEAFQQADQLYQLTSNLEGLTEVAYERGVAANRQLRLAEAAAYLQKAMDTARLASNLHQEFRARVQLASNAFLAGDGAQAETYARESLDIAQTDQMQILAATGIIYLGNSYLRRRDFITAEKYYRDALALARRSGSSRLAASSLASLAGLHDQLDRSDEVAQEAQAALDYYQANRFASESSQCLTLLGRVRRKQSDYAGALTYFQRALEEAEKSKDRPQIAVAHESIGGVYLAREQYPRALEEFRKYLDLSTDAQHVGYANLRYGEMLWRLGRYAEATAALDKADGNATKYPSLRLSILKARAGLLLSQARSREAVELAQSAIALSGRDQSSDAFLNSLLGVAYIESGNRREGIRKCELALAAAVNSTDIVAVLQSRVMLARARLEAGDTNRAKDLLLQAEPLLTTYPESHWRTLALLAKVDPHYLGIAREALAELKRQWGDGAYGEYINRPDVRQLSWHVLQLNTANHQ